jgi:outer membrane protein OmpA-like peptidoglycan-associated protein
MKAWHLGVLGLAMLGCATRAQPVQTTSATLPPPNAQGEYAPDWPQMGRGEARFITIQLGPDTYSHCRDVSPKFAFDSPLTYVQDRAQLAAFARCMNHEEMQSRHVLLVGRADPRGSATYNLELGSRRAEQIKALLVLAGLSADRIDVATEGKRDAKGNTGDYSFGYDRRVDVVVAGGSHHP